MTYKVSTISLLTGDIIKKYYEGNDRNEANKILHNLQKEGIGRIEFVDKNQNCVYQYTFKDKWSYRIKKKYMEV